MKKVAEWLDQLPEPYRTKALENHKGYKGYGYSANLYIALILAFKWSSSPEGKKFWEGVHQMVRTGIYKPIPKKKVKPPKPEKRKAKRIVNKADPDKIYHKVNIYPNIDDALKDLFIKNKNK